jgi:large subunit ribosomal protein L21e
MKRIGGFRRKSRHKFKKNIRQKGKISLKKYLQTFKEGDKVQLIVEPSVHKGMYFPKFISKIGIIKKKIRKCYELVIKDKNKEKILIAHPVHLKRI